MLSSSIKLNGDTASLCAPTKWAYRPSAHRLAQRTIFSNSLFNVVQHRSSNKSDDPNSAVGTRAVFVSRALRLVSHTSVAAFCCQFQYYGMIEVTRISRSYMSEAGSLDAVQGALRRSTTLFGHLIEARH